MPGKGDQSHGADRPSRQVPVPRQADGPQPGHLRRSTPAKAGYERLDV